MSEEVKAEDAKASEAPAQANAPAQADAPAAAELTVQDLQALKNIIDVSTQRGAFKGNELMSVGQVYNKLEAFLGAVAQNQAPTAPQGE
jgi:hypothetical protein